MVDGRLTVQQLTELSHTGWEVIGLAEGLDGLGTELPDGIRSYGVSIASKIDRHFNSYFSEGFVPADEVMTGLFVTAALKEHLHIGQSKQLELFR